MAVLLTKLLISVVVLTAVSLSAPAEALANPASLAVRLQSDGLAQCWESLLQLRACTGEVILFFLNGQTYLGPSCCRAIRVIEHHCWAADAMLAALGFTAQERDTLRGFCDANSDENAPPAQPAAPIPASDVGGGV